MIKYINTDTKIPYIILIIITIEWIKAIPGSATIKDLRFAESYNGEFLIGGTYEESISNEATVLMSEGGTDVFVWKISSNGENIWLKSFGGIGNEDVKGIESLKSGSILSFICIK